MNTEHYVDKSDWRPGPWIDEPDRVGWRAHGMPCLIVRGPLGALCGYVGLPPSHPMHGRGYDDVRRADGEWPEVHGGLTYSERCQEPPGKICHVPAAGEADDVHWLGFDCAHAGDYTDMKHAEGSDFARYMAAAGVALRSPGDLDQYRDLDYVRREVESLAAQMAEGL
jgi:hypothetical protein